MASTMTTALAGPAAVTVMWLRRDLRLSDNPALLEALRNGRQVVPLFVVDPALWGPSGTNRRAFLVGCLNSLNESFGGRLVVRRGRPEQVVARLAQEVEAPWVFMAEDFGPYGRARDERVARALARSGRALAGVGSPYAVEPGDIHNHEGNPYKVFTPFRRAWRDHGWDRPARPPVDGRWSDGVPSDPIPDAPESTIGVLPPAGEPAAKAAARRFWDRHLDGYAECRNVPGADATSRLSPYLKWGCLHPRQLLAKLEKSADTSANSFRDELCWREFYADVLFNDHASARRAWNPAMRAMRVDEGRQADERFAAWAEGRTGYPLVDAGMRQLLAEGWMHNRVRMAVASFLVKDLHLDWGRGARHFMRHLVDGDLASNTHGWQWVAGTGTDPSPYVRVFNPVSQSKRFDPQGGYIHRYVLELNTLEAPEVHEPWLLPGGPPNGYPRPVVDHASERLEALARYDDRR